MTMRLIKYGLPVVAVILFIVAVRHVVVTGRDTVPSAPSGAFPAPSVSPFAAAVAGAGIVEARTENISLGAPLPGIVREVFVEVGHPVQPGERLFRLDDRELQAELMVREALLESAQAEFDRLNHLPRPEEIPALEAQIREAAAVSADRERRLYRVRRLSGAQAATEEDLEAATFAADAAKAAVERAQAQLDLLKAGAWDYEKQVASAAVKRAQAEVSEVKTNLDRLVVNAPVAGEILQVNVRPGEYVSVPPGKALIVLGNTEQLHIRVDIDENDIPRYPAGASAVASLKGDPQATFPLEFVRIEPYVVPKRSLTGDNTERIDTRVLQVIYRVAGDGAPRLFVGQQVDVYINASQEGR
jgi:HlyD family secretion protein